MDIETSFRDPFTQDQLVIRLNDEELRLKTVANLVAQLDALQPGLRVKLIAEKRDALTTNQREALDTPAEKRTGRQVELAAQATDALQVTHDEVARRITGANARKPSR